jgi:hypothetical protein
VYGIDILGLRFLRSDHKNLKAFSGPQCPAEIGYEGGNPSLLGEEVGSNLGYSQVLTFVLVVISDRIKLTPSGI